MLLCGGYKPQRISKGGTLMPFSLTGPRWDIYSSEYTPLNSVNVINMSNAILITGSASVCTRHSLSALGTRLTWNLWTLHVWGVGIRLVMPPELFDRQIFPSLDNFVTEPLCRVPSRWIQYCRDTPTNACMMAENLQLRQDVLNKEIHTF